MKIKIGRYYRNRGGQAVFVYSREGSSDLYPLLGVVVVEGGFYPLRRTYTETGEFLKNGSENFEDLIEEWGDAPRPKLTLKTIQDLKSWNTYYDW